jgi:hypothetical protein
MVGVAWRRGTDVGFSQGRQDVVYYGGLQLLVVGSRGRGASEALLGSVAERLIADGRVPVLVVGKNAVRRDLNDARTTAVVA